MRDIELPAETQSADFAEIVFPDEMIRYIMVEQIRSLCIMEFAITGYGDGIAEEPESRGYISIDIDITYRTSEKTESCRCLVSKN